VHLFTRAVKMTVTVWYVFWRFSVRSWC